MAEWPSDVAVRAREQEVSEAVTAGRAVATPDDERLIVRVALDATPLRGSGLSAGGTQPTGRLQLQATLRVPHTLRLRLNDAPPAELLRSVAGGGGEGAAEALRLHEALCAELHGVKAVMGWTDTREYADVQVEAAEAFAIDKVLACRVSAKFVSE